MVSTTGAYNLRFLFDDRSKVNFEGITKFDYLHDWTYSDENFNVNLIQGQYYYLEMWYKNDIAGGYAKLNWTPPGSSEEVTPASVLYYRRHVGSTPYQVSVTCPTGYSGVDASSPYKCREICGDGIRIGDEI
jgi:hypothetical protein